MEEWIPKWLAKNWKGSSGSVANKDLWEGLLETMRPHKVKWQWVKGHTGNTFNARVNWLVMNPKRQN